VLDARGAIGVTERASYFRRMRDMTRRVAKAHLEQRQEMEFPLDKLEKVWGVTAPSVSVPGTAEVVAPPQEPADFLFEIGVEEMPAEDVDDALAQLQEAAPKLFDDLRLAHEGVEVHATPRRLVIMAKKVAPRQPDRELVARGPSADKAFDADGKPTKAAEGFARSKGISVDALRIEDLEGGRYVVATVHETGRPAVDVLAEALPNVVAGIKFGKSMRWNASGVAFSRPIRWYVALLGNFVIPFGYAGIQSGNVTRGLRPYG